MPDRCRQARHVRRRELRELRAAHPETSPRAPEGLVDQQKPLAGKRGGGTTFSARNRQRLGRWVHVYDHGRAYTDDGFVLCDRLLTLAQDADRAGLRRAAESLFELVGAVLEPHRSVSAGSTPSPRLLWVGHSRCVDGWPRAEIQPADRWSALRPARRSSTASWCDTLCSART
jgi:hypothetical protein